MDILQPEFVAALVGTVGLCWTLWTAYVRRRQKQFEVLQQSFELLQRINEVALQSDKHLCAALKSANPAEPFDAHETRELYFHYMRINRLFRAYEYWKGRFITKAQRDRIVCSHIASLLPVATKLPSMLKRGYPDDFAEYLVGEVRAGRTELPMIGDTTR